MKNFSLIFILICFIIQIIYWVCNSFSVKKTVENKGGWTMRIIAIIVVISFVFLQKYIIEYIPFLGKTFWQNSLRVGIIADVITFFGLIFMIWSRKTLGKNWSANVTFKENHDLVMTGPYRFVRHPIYSGLLLMILGVIIYVGNLFSLIIFVMFFFGAYYKAHKEEILLIKYFGENYLNYKKNVKALIPFVF